MIRYSLLIIDIYMDTSDEYLDKLIAETLKKKPVNSDHYCIIKKVKPGEKFSKNPDKNQREYRDPLNQRIKDLMDRVGFSYGRLKEKDWVTERSEKKTLMIAPGPVMNAMNRKIPKVFFDDKFKAKYPNGFDKPSYGNYSSHSVDAKKTQETSTNRFLSQSPSQRQAKEYLQFLTAISSEEKKILQHKIDGKVQDFKKDLYLQVPKEVNNLNNRGIFSTQVNEIRANSMLNVKLRNQMKIKLEPIVRSVKAEVLKERMDAWNASTEYIIKPETYQQDIEKRNKLLQHIGATVSKNIPVKMSDIPLNTVHAFETDWTEVLAESMNKTKIKCTPIEISILK